MDKAPRSKRPITDPVEARVALIDGTFALPDENKEAMAEIRRAVKECAEKIKDSVRKKAKKHDTGRLIHSLDLLQQVKDTACVSVILPFAEAEEAE
jgi:hypothetical protein